MSADKNPTTVAALMAERDRKIASRERRAAIGARRFLVQICGCDLFRGKKFFAARKPGSPRFTGLSRYRL
jgi:hypothetical protein